MRYLLLISSLILSSCIPPRPKTDLCMVNAVDKDCDCAHPDGSKYILTLNECDTYLAISPKDSQTMENYVLELQKALEKCPGN